MTSKVFRPLVILMMLAVLIAGCGTSSTPSPTSAPTQQISATSPTQAAAPTEAAAPTTDSGTSGGSTTAPAAYAELTAAENGQFKGTSVSIFGVWLEQEETDFKATLDAFSKRTGITINYEGSKDFETLITVRAEGNDAPDIAIFPQPGLMTNLARKDKLVALDSFMPAAQVKQDYIQSWIDLGTVDGELYGVFFRANAKSLVWYPVKAFEEAGYAIPETWDELIALSDQMVADGNTPWCVALEQAGATGWYATDWVEEILLRTAGPATYDKWAKHEIPFNDPSVKRATEIMGEIWLNEEYVYGGTTGILSTQVADAANPMFEEPTPGCWMYKQAGWASAFFPEGKKAGTDADFFYFPPIDPAHGSPVEGGGDVVGMFNDRPEVRAVMQYLATADAGKAWAQKGGFISPIRNVPLEWYPEGPDRRQAEIIQSATVFRFDASDLMPGEVGTGTFWKGMVDYVGGEDLDTVLNDIESSWPNAQ